MAATVTREQRLSALRHRRKDDLARYHLAVADAAGRLTPALGLSDEQARQLKKLLMEEIDPPLESGESDHAYIMFQFAQLPEARVKPIFTDAQWQLLRKVRSSWETRERFLSKGGY
jgi:hypothetical protein